MSKNEGKNPSGGWKGLEGNKVKAKKGSAKVANASKKTGVGGLASKKPKVALPKGKEKAKVSGKTGNLASKSPKKLKAKSSGPVSRNKTKVKLADYVF